MLTPRTFREWLALVFPIIIGGIVGAGLADALHWAWAVPCLLVGAASGVLLMIAERSGK
jgi:hypothetical protein